MPGSRIALDVYKWTTEEEFEADVRAWEWVQLIVAAQPRVWDVSPRLALSFALQFLVLQTVLDATSARPDWVQPHPPAAERIARLAQISIEAVRVIAVGAQAEARAAMKLGGEGAHDPPRKAAGP